MLFLFPIIVGGIVISLGIVIVLLPLEKLLTPTHLLKIPNWLRWVLVLPSALLVSTIFEIVCRMLFALVEVLVNHHLTFSPEFSMTVYQLFEPLIFVVVGVQIAPRKVLGFVGLGGFKFIIACANLISNLQFVLRGGSWKAVDDVILSPVWWNFLVEAVSAILILLVFVLLLFEKYKFKKIFITMQQKNK